MPDLFVMRHAKSDWSTDVASDFERPLSRRGHRAAKLIAGWLDEHDLEPDLIVSSSAVRARETAGYVAERFEMRDRMQLRDELYLASSATWFETLRDLTDDRVLICGHNPGLDDLVELLSAGALGYTDDGKLMTTGAVAHFALDAAWSTIEPGLGELRALVRPRELDRD